jgi:hypothetical protein
MVSLFTLGAILFAFQGIGVDPDTIGSNSHRAIIYHNQWGYNVPDELPANLRNASVSAFNNTVINTHYGGAGGPVNFLQVRVHAAPDLSGNLVTKWLMDAYDVQGYKFENCTFDTCPVEHGNYFKAIGGIEWKNVVFEDIAGQGIQVVYANPGSKREHQTGKAPQRWWREFFARRWEEHSLDHVAFIQVSMPAKSERASFAASFFGMDAPYKAHPVSFDFCQFKTYDPWVDVNGIARDCAGAIMVHNRLRCIITNTRVLYGKGDRDLIQLWGISDGKAGTEDIIIRQNEINGSKPVDIRVWDDKTTIRIQRNRGNAEVVISSNPPYVWENNGWDEGLVIYRGKISDNYAFN